MIRYLGEIVRPGLLFLALSVLTVAAVSCGSSTEEEVKEQPAAKPATEPTAAAAVSAPTPQAQPKTEATTPAQPTAAPTATPTPEPSGPIVLTAETSGFDPAKYVGTCEGLDYDAQKARLIDIGNEIFAGVTEHDPEMTKLHNPPDARDRRQGGIWLVIEFNGDERANVPQKKARLDVQMRDAFEAFYRAGCADLQEVHIAVRMVALGAGVIGPMTQTLAAVFKTKLKPDVAETIDWDNKDNLDFNEIWDTMLLHTRWRKALREYQEQQGQ
jgi:hypothetical protein